ncbi:MAG: DUF4331 family protein [Myxococcota bacterium]|nr:DUF4331 family protein [Myxococcota bacterium]
MRTRSRPILLGGLSLTALSLAIASSWVQAADHIDSPAAVAEPTADITDLFAWNTQVDGETRLNLVMDVNPFAGADAQFSDSVQYVFHVGSTTAYGEATTETEVQCQFSEPTAIECWVGDQYVAGDPTDPAGIVSDGGGIRVFAGRRNDPFFMEFTGFTNAVSTVVSAAGALEFDPAGCPTVDADTANAIVGQLQSGEGGAPASDTFAGADVLSLVVQLDPALVTPGGPLVAVWASTHRAP